MSTPSLIISQHAAFYGKHDKHNIPVVRASGGRNNFSAYIYSSGVNIDCDGAPTAYGWNRTGVSKHPTDIERLQQGLYPLLSGHSSRVD
jgi:hypothetical protein